MIERYIAAPLDGAARKRSIATIAALLALLILVMMIRQILPLVTLLAVPVILAPAFAFAGAPLGYTLNETCLTIDRKTLWSIRIPLSQITACHPLPRTSLRDAIRVYGTGGLFGWAGRYNAPEIGTITMYATNLDRLIIVKRRKRRSILISPDDTAAFIRGLQRQYQTIVIPPHEARRSS